MNTINYAILSTPAGSGRDLTSTEAARLRKLGVSCSTAWVVSYDGFLHQPCRTGGHDGTGLRACEQ